MKNTKKIIGLIIAAVLILSLSVCYFAAGDSDDWKSNQGTINLDNLAVTGEGIEVDGNVISISKGGDFTVTGSLEDGMIKVNTGEKVKLRLSGMSLKNSSGPAIFFENTEKGFITLTENTENYLADGTEYSVEDADAPLFSNDDLEIKGAGKLTVAGNYKHGIASDDSISIENGTIVIVSAEHGIKTNDKVSITGGNIDITAKTGKGIKAGEELVIDAGVLNIVSEQSEGLESKGTITINGGDINITAADDGINTGSSNSQNGLGGREKMPGGDFENGEPPQMPDMNGEAPAERQGGRGMKGGMPGGDFENGEPPQMPDMNGETPSDRQGGRGMKGGMPGGDFENGEPPQMPDMNGEAPTDRQGGRNFGGFGKVDEETAAAHAITINGGNIRIKASGDGIDSNGSLTVTGGTLIIDGPEMNGNGPLDSEGEMTITGGEIITLSSAGMLQLPTDADTQNTLKVVFTGQGAAGDTVSVKDSAGNELMSLTSQGKYAALIYSSEKLKAGEEYSVFVNGNLYKTVTLEKGITSVGSSSGFMGGFGMREKGESKQM